MNHPSPDFPASGQLFGRLLGAAAGMVVLLIILAGFNLGVGDVLGASPRASICSVHRPGPVPTSYTPGLPARTQG
jgi:hypothetical protein